MVSNVSGVNSSVTQTETTKFMAKRDLATADEANARLIGEFLKDKKAQEARRVELQNYLLETYKNKDGSNYFTDEEAYILAGDQVNNEKSQAKAKITVPFIDEVAYNAAVERAKEGKEDCYNYVLIKDKEVLSMINGDKITDEAEKEANYKKFFLTNDKGELVQTSEGKYIFDPDKYKAEMANDTDTDYKLNLSERKDAAFKRGLSKNAEKNAIKATGMDVRRDNSGLYKGLAVGVGLAGALFGVAKATATAVGCGTYASAKAVAWGGAAASAVVGAAGAAFLEDRDAKLNKRQISADLFNSRKEEEIAEEPVIEEEPVVEEEIPVEEPVEEEPCYSFEEGVQVKTIKYGGYWHYANLYNNCETGRKLTNQQINELTQLLKPGHENSSIQQGDSNRVRILQPEITLKDGTKVCLADTETVNKRIAELEAQTTNGNAQMKLDKQTVIIKDCCSGKVVGTASNRQEAEDFVRRQQAK